MNSDTNIISQRAFLKESASLQKLKTKLFFKLDTYCLSRQKTIPLKVMRYFSLQINLSLLNSIPSSINWSLPDPT